MCTTTVAVSADMQLRAAAQPTRATAQLALIHAWIDPNLFLESSLWLRSEMRQPLSTRLSSQHLTPSARYVFNLLFKAIVITDCFVNSVFYSCLFITRPPTSLYYITYSHNVFPYLKWKHIGIRHTPCLISDFWLSFLMSISGTASANNH